MNEWTSARLRRATLERLHQVAKGIVIASEKGRRTAIDPRPENLNPRHLGVSLDDVVNRLLDELEGKNRRKRRSRERRRQQKGGGA